MLILKVLLYSQSPTKSKPLPSPMSTYSSMPTLVIGFQILFLLPPCHKKGSLLYHLWNEGLPTHVYNDVMRGLISLMSKL